jgi:SAM-dependent methyltransferase
LRYFEERGFFSTGLTGAREIVLPIESHGPSYAAINRLAYDVLANEYEERSKSPGSSQESPTRFLELLTSRLTSKSTRVLELGPGAGDMLKALSEVFEVVVGVELSGRMAALASERAPRALVVRGDILAIDFGADSFDAVFAGAFLHLFPVNDAELLVQRIVRWLRPGGYAFVNTTVAATTSEGFERKADYLGEVVRYRARWTEAAFRKMLDNNGLRVVERITTNEAERSKFWIGYLCEPTRPRRE